jgi:mannose-6-phosphate isomerase-like protein (cupin superfamily)
MVTDDAVSKHVPPGEGEAYWVGGEHLTFKVRGADTDQAVALLEDTVQPGYGPPPHIHLHENEAFYVLAGEFTFTLGERTMPAPPGTLLTVPKGQLHTFQNVGATPGRLLALVWPAVAFEGFVAEVGSTEPPSGPPDLEKLLAAAKKYGIAVPPPEPGGA